MKKIKKLLTITLALIMLFCLCLCFTSCDVEPFFIEKWYLTGYTDENGENHSVGYDTIKQECLYSDEITIQYFEDKTFVFKEFDKEYTGTYTYKKSGKKETTISLTFSDGTKGKGTCAKYMFDGAWYEGTLQAFGKHYSFADDFTGDERAERYDFPYKHAGENIIEMLKDGKTEKYVFHYNSSYKLYKGKIENRNGEYWFIPNDDKYAIQNLSQARELYTYEIKDDGTTERGDNQLRESKCFINYNEYRVLIDSENCETKSEYAVWYYADFFEKIAPLANLKQEDVLSVRADVDINYDTAFATNIWEKGSKELKNFYEICSEQYVLPITEIDDTERNFFNITTFYIKTAEQTYKIIYMVDHETCYFIVDGKYYKNLSYNYLLLIPRGDKFYSIKSDASGSKFFIGENYIKTYGDFDLIFAYDYDYEGEKTSDYILKLGEHTLILLDGKHFIWQAPAGNNICREIVGEDNFSEIFEEYPLLNEH